MKNMLLAAALVASAGVPAGAATLYVGHGIPGKVFGDASNKLAVDVCVVNGPAIQGLAYPVELFPGVEFGQFAQVPLDLPAGRYDVEVQLPSGGTCDGDAAVAGSVFLGLGENATAFAHLTEQGTPTLTKYVNDMRPLASGLARVYARHGAAVGDVDVTLKGQGWPVVIRSLENPDQEGADLRAGSTRVTISRDQSWWRSSSKGNHYSSPLFSAQLDLAAGNAYFAYAVGIPSSDPSKSTFTVLLQTFAVK
jgi:hypothetical protein